MIPRHFYCAVHPDRTGQWAKSVHGQPWYSLCNDCYRRLCAIGEHGMHDYAVAQEALRRKV